MFEYVQTFDADWTAVESEAGNGGSILGPRLHPQHPQSSSPSSQTRTRVKKRVRLPEWEELVSVKKWYHSN